ncbi:MAG: IS21 family transposase [Chloroflexota bacterium]|nr:IS21 family transposase [Chloroflexota bacterium]MDQ6910118.1 IS21 family transposase [Actinomycetota bacterium]
MRKIRDVLRLRLQEGLSLRDVSASLQLPLTTVGEHVRRAKAAGLDWPLPEGLDDDALEALLFPKATAPTTGRPQPDWEKVHRELRRPHVTLSLLWLEHKEAFPEAHNYSQFCELYRRWRRHVDVVMRQEHKAGEKLFVDFPGRRIPIYDPNTGHKVFEAELFVAVLGASSYLYAEAVRSQELIHWVTAHVHAFEFLDGCPSIVVCDNLRSGVTRPHRYEPDVNATYQDMAAHYGVAIIPARRYKPRDKAKVEAGVLVAERWIMARLRNERFGSLGEANVEIRRLVEWVNARPFKKLAGSRRSLYEELDRPALRPLPADRYEFAIWRKAKVNIDYHIEVRAPERHYYSVPYRLAGESVDVRLSAATVEVFHRHSRVASHVRRFSAGYSTDPAHMPKSHRRHAAWTPSRIVAWAAKTGPATAKLAEAIIAARAHPEQGFRSCLGIVRLGERFGTERLEAACERALAARAYSYKSVESILRTGLDRKPLPAEGPPRAHPSHDNLRGPDYYQ